MAVADIVDFVRRQRQAVFSSYTLRCMLHNPNNTLDNVVDIGEISFAVPVIKDADLLSFYQLVRKSEVGHVWTTGGAINRKEA